MAMRRSVPSTCQGGVDVDDQRTPDVDLMIGSLVCGGAPGDPVQELDLIDGRD